MKIIIADINSKFIDNVENIIQDKKFKHLENLSTYLGSFTDLANSEHNICMVGAGNSFGLLSGGVDLAIRNFFGKNIEYKLQDLIKEDFCGELVVGSSLVMPTGHNGIKFLGYTPTMRVPKNIKGTDIPYTATLSALSTIKRHNKISDNKIDTILLPGMGTGTGSVPFYNAAIQMVYAIDNFYYSLQKGTLPVKSMKEAFHVENNIKGVS